jgi:RNA-directed DNA polymerase
MPMPTRAGVMEDGRGSPSEKGVPQGGPLSPLLAYIVLHDYRPTPERDEWIRRRLRMCYWKQGRRCRKRVRERLDLGVSERQAVLTALSRKSYWHLSRTMATQRGITNAWLESQGLVSVRTRWMAFHYPVANQPG